MQTKPKANSVVTHKVDPATGIVTFTVLNAGSFDFDPRKAHAGNRKHAELHGWLQRIADKAAVNRDPKTGLPVSPAVKMARMRALADWYQSGAEAWSPDRGPVGPRFDRAILLGVAQMAGVDEATAMARCDRAALGKGITLGAYLQGMHDGQGDGAKRLREIVAGIRASEAGPTAIDADAELDAMMSGDADDDDDGEGDDGPADGPNTTPGE